MRKLTCNAEHCKDRDDDGLDDEGGELLQGLLIRLPHLLYVRSIWGCKCSQQIQWHPNCFDASSLLPPLEWATTALYLFENLCARIDLLVHLMNIKIMIVYVGDPKDLCIRKVRDPEWTLNGP